MDNSKILIVEDEAIIAMEMADSLETLGYHVTGTVSSGSAAIEQAAADKPDLVIMDIRLKGEMDGISAAEAIREKHGIPVVFSTAYLDHERIERAKITMPFGYILKPIQNRELQVTVEMALYVSEIETKRKAAEKRIRDSELKLRSLLEAAPIGIQFSDLEGRITYSNKKHRSIHGLSETEILGQYLWSFNQDDAEKEKEKEGYFRFIETGECPVFYGVDVSGSGDSYYYVVQRSLLRDSDGRIYAVCSFLTDITDVKRE